ncbi:MAG: hypothetical protein HYY50_04205 [Candidatus Kerfeldbacteria bacterium]|nr:hypothetical protein [Candidatus Kerfeldbacteria bacterium]
MVIPDPSECDERELPFWLRFWNTALVAALLVPLAVLLYSRPNVIVARYCIWIFFAGTAGLVLTAFIAYLQTGPAPRSTT